MRQHIGAILLIPALALTVACSGASAATPPPAAPAVPAAVSPSGTQQITLTVANRMTFDPAAFVVKAGQPVELTLRNEGHMPHDFTLSEGVAQPVQVHVDGGETASTTFTIDQPGTYTFICSVGGHAAAGMKGTITVQ